MKQGDRLFQIPPRENGGRWFCGPAAIAALTGRSFEEIRAKINEGRGRCAHQAVRGTFQGEVLRALEDFAQTWKRIGDGGRGGMTLGRWRKEKRGTGRYLILITRHWIVVRDRVLLDNKHPNGIHIADAGYDRRKIRAVYRIQHRIGGTEG